MAPRLENRSERRVAATEREKRRMGSFNVKVDAIRDIVCPTMKSATKAKVLRAAVDRLMYLEALAAKMNGQSSPLVQQPFNHVTSAVNEQTVSYNVENGQPEYQEALYEASSPSNSLNSWNSPVDYAQNYTEDNLTNQVNHVTYYDDNANLYPANIAYDVQAQVQPDVLASQVLAYNDDARVSFSDSYQPETTQVQHQQPEMTPADHFFKEFEAQLNDSIL